MERNYQLKSGQLYAKVPGHSVQQDGKIIKTGVLYLGRVIDRGTQRFLQQRTRHLHLRS